MVSILWPFIVSIFIVSQSPTSNKYVEKAQLFIAHSLEPINPVALNLDSACKLYRIILQAISLYIKLGSAYCLENSIMLL